MKHTVSRIVWGLILIAAGVLFGLNQLDILPFELFFDGWWTLFIIVPSVMALLFDKDKWGGIIGLLFGVFFLLCEWDVLTFDLLWKLALPIAAVLVGLRLIFGRGSKKAEKCRKKQAEFVSADGARCVAVFSGQEARYDGQDFRGGEAVAVFGGVDLFAANALITEDCTLNVAAVFGGVDVYLPAGVNVEVASGGVFGGVENLRRLPPIEGAPTVYVNAAAVFGGVDIK